MPFNRKHTAEEKRRISLTNTGRVFTPEAREKIRLRLMGNTNAKGYTGEKSGKRWKGGVTKFYQAIRTCYQYRQWRSDVLTRDNYTCVECLLQKPELHADHIKPMLQVIKKYGIKTLEDAKKCSEMWDINNGRTLCVECHIKTDTWGKREI